MSDGKQTGTIYDLGYKRYLGTRRLPSTRSLCGYMLVGWGAFNLGWDFPPAAVLAAGAGVQVLNREDSWSREMAVAGRTQVTFGTDASQPPTLRHLTSVDGRTWTVDPEPLTLGAAR